MSGWHRESVGPILALIEWNAHTNILFGQLYIMRTSHSENLQMVQAMREPEVKCELS